EAGKVDLEVYNILGEKVSTLVNQEMSTGIHEVNFKASNLASGIYIYRINVNNRFIDTKKMILMK
ncbi:MAG: T9SS type A sorting domain-containing protein, partial [Ignavibacteriaceae bacterium]